MKINQNQKGQSAAEFILISPLLFLIFFCIIQMAYMAFVSLAVQRAALSVARKASLSGNENSTYLKTQLAISLLPLANLSTKTLLTILESDCRITTSQDKKQISAQVRYPMPIWVPLVRNLFGIPLVHSENYNDSPVGQAIKKVFSLAKKPEPDLAFEGLSLPIRWVVFSGTTFNEAYRTPQ